MTVSRYLILQVLIAGAAAFQQPFSSRQLSYKQATRRYSSTLAEVNFRVNVEESCPRDINSMQEWAAACGAQRSEGFQLRDVGDDVYAITIQNLPADSPILFIPSQMILTGSKAWQEFSATDPSVLRVDKYLMEKENVPFYLFVKILKEYSLGDQSPWYPWLNSLPRYYSNGASMTDFCFGCLPPYAATQALEEKTRLKRFELALNEVSSGTIPDTVKLDSDITKWAYNVVYTRYQETADGNDYVIAPLGDYFNHGGSEVDAYFSYDEAGNCYVYSLRDVPAGQPLRICYGDPTNPSQLLAKFGFLDESSPATYCKWIADEPSSELSYLGYPSKMLFYNDGSISREVWDVLLYDELGKVSPLEQQAFFQAHASGDETTKQEYHQRYFSQTLAALRMHVNFLVNELDELSESTIWKKNNEYHPRLPLLMQHNEFVRNIFYLVQQNLDNMG